MDALTVYAESGFNTQATVSCHKFLIMLMIRRKLIALVLLFVLPGLPVATPAQTTREQAILRVQELLQQQKLAEARQALVTASRKYPRDPGLDNLLGIIEAQQHNYAAAEKAFTRAITRAPGFTGAYLNLGRLYLEHVLADEQALTKALRIYQRLLQQQPDQLEANYQCAFLLQARGEYQTALGHLARLPESYLQSAQSLALLCAVYAGLGEKARADEAAQLLIAHPDFTEADVTGILGTLTRMQRNDLSIRLLESLTARMPVTPDTWHRFGLLYEQQGQFDRARATLEKAAVKDRPLVPLLVDLARVAHRQADHQGALGYLAHARDLAPQNAALHYFFGMICVDLKLGAEAYLALSKAVGLAPDNPQYNYALGVVASFRHDPSEAIPYLKKYRQLKPDDARGQLMLGVAYFKSKDYAAARQELIQVVSHKETAATAHYYLGSIARLSGELAEAIRALQQALQLRPDYPDALAELGQCLLQQKDYGAAETHLRRALALAPNHYAANFNLLTLYSRTQDARLAEQSRRFEEIKQQREESMQEFLRAVEVRSYPTPFAYQ